ncbi:MAG: 50S ribosomal protein L11 methyltransferase [Blastocatellia bacterium]
MKKDQRQDKDNYLHTLHVFRGQGELLTDEARNRAFSSAIRKHVRPGSSVLDIGTGTGIWAIAAALAGADRVVAVERDSLLIPIIRNTVKENGVSDRVEVVHGSSRHLELNERFDLIVSETIGNQAFEEEIVPIMTDARKRYLKPGGVLIPSDVSFVVAPAHFENYLEGSPAGVSMKYSYFQTLNINIPLVLIDKSRLKIISSPKELIRVDLNQSNYPPDLSHLTAQWKHIDTPDINCFAVWAEMTLARGVKISTLKTSSWSPVIYLIKPFKQSRGTVEFTLNMTEKTHYWSAALSNRKENELHSYSPVFAYTSLINHIRKAEAFSRKK